MEKIIEITLETIKKVVYDTDKYEYEVCIQYNKYGEKTIYSKRDRAKSENEANEILEEFKEEFIDEGYKLKYNVNSIKKPTIENAKIIKEKIEKSEDEYIVYFYHQDIDKESITYTIERADTEEEAYEKLETLKNCFKLRNKEIYEKKYNFTDKEKEVKPDNISDEEYRRILNAVKTEEKSEMSDDTMQEYYHTTQYDFLKLYTHGWKNFTNFLGRTNRGEYWTFVLVNVILSIILSLIHVVLGMMFYFAILIPGLAICIRRLRDAGKHPADICWALVPFVGWIVALVNVCSPSVRHDKTQRTQSTFLQWLPIIIIVIIVMIVAANSN